MVETIGVPGRGQSPDLLERHHGTARHLTLAAPAIHVLFRPEEQNRRSRVGDVLPEPFRRDGVVNDPVTVNAAVADRHRDLLTAVRALRPAFSVTADERQHSRGIPRAVRPIGAARNRDRIRAWAPPKTGAPSRC